MRSNFSPSRITALLLVVALLFSVSAVPVLAKFSSEQQLGTMQEDEDGAQAHADAPETQWRSEPDYDLLEIGAHIFTPDLTTGYTADWKNVISGLSDQALALVNDDTDDSGELFKFEVTVSAGATFIIPTRGSSGVNSADTNRSGNTYDWKIDWGDGNMETASGTAGGDPSTGGIPHTYVAGGTYTITITPDGGTDRWLAAFGFGMSETSGQCSTANRKMISKVISPITPLMTRTQAQISGNSPIHYEWSETFYHCTNLTMGDDFTFSDEWDTITTVGNDFAYSMFRACSGDNFTMNDVFNLPTGITTVNTYFAGSMFTDCFGSSFKVNDVFKFPALDQENLNRNGVFFRTFKDLGGASTQTRTAESIINNTLVPNKDRETFTRSTCFSDLDYIPTRWGGGGLVENAETPNIIGHPQGAAYANGAQAEALTVTASVSDGGTLSYQWYFNTEDSNSGGTEISDAADSSYIPSTDINGTVYYYCVVTNRNDSAIVTKTATATSNTAAITVNDGGGPAALTGTAVISGTAKVGQTLTAGLTGSNNTGILSYQWKADNVDIPGATGSAYTLTAAELGRVITVEVTSSVETGAVVSSPTSAVAAADPDALTGTAVISGTAKVGQTLTAGLTGSNNTGILSYQWKADNVDIPGATGSAYTLTAAELGRVITVEVTSSVETGAVVSSPTSAVAAADPDALTGTAVISGTAKVGQTLTAGLTGSNNTGILSYQWKADSVDIPGATGSIYTLTAAELGRVITVEVTSSVETGAVVSLPTSAVAAADPDALTGTAVISGTAKVGQTLTAGLTGSNNTGILSYQWKADNVDIPGATGSIYTLTAAELGRVITVEVTSSVETGAVVSSPTSAVAAADLGTVPVTGVTLDRSSLSLHRNTSLNTATLTATVTPSDATDKTVTWASGNTAVAAVDQGGNVTAVGNGTAVITVTTTEGGYTASCTVTVTTTGGGGGSSTNTAAFTVAFNTQGGDSVSSQRVERSKTATEPEPPMREGYTFTGWYTDADCTEAYDFNTPVMGSLTLYAGWEAGEPEPETVSPYIEGYPDGTFKPDGKISRAEAATILYNLTNGEINTSQTAVAGADGFSDVSADAWYYDAVMELAGAGVFNGHPDGSFGPEEQITRAEFTTMIVRCMSLEAAGVAGFPDVPASNWASGYIAAAQAAGLIDGYPNGNFGPDIPLTRAQAVTVLNRMLGRSTDKPLFNELEMPFTDVEPSHWAYWQIMMAVEHKRILGD